MNMNSPHVRLACKILEVAALQPDSQAICVGVAGDLAQNPITTPRIPEHQCWSQLTRRRQSKESAIGLLHSLQVCPCSILLIP